MAVFLIALTKENEGLQDRIEKNYPASAHVKITDTLYMVKPSVASMHAISNEVGISADANAPSGMVIKISNENVTGVLPATIVEWYKEAMSENQES